MSGEKTAAGSRQIGWRMALYLGGKISVSTNDLPPKEATQMSYDVKYIGMDVHKEAIVIAVLNESGKQVIESVSSKPKPAAFCSLSTVYGASSM